MIDFYVTDLIVLFLILLSAFFSGSETALTALSRAKIHKLGMEGNKRAMLVSKLRKNRDKLLGTILIGNNIVNVAASALTTAALVELFGTEGVIYATFLITILLVVFAEIMPKTYAFSHAEKVALLVAPAIKVFVVIFSPIAALVHRIVNGTFELFKIKVEAHKNTADTASELIRGTIDLYHFEGGVVKFDRDMLGSILDLAETEVEEVMIHRKNMMTINIEERIEDIMQSLMGKTFTRIPIWKDDPDNIIGILNTKDLLTEIYQHGGDLTRVNLESILTKPWFIPATTSLRNQLLAFRQKHYHFALVVDEYGALLGMVTLEDILEEIVGSIYDEHDSAMSTILDEGGGSYIVDGGVTVRDLNRQLDWNLPDDKATTVAGLLIEEVKIIPDPGEHYNFYGIRFEVLRKHKNQLMYLRLKKVGKK